MCGIAACLSLVNENVAGKIISMLKRLEYRGYDSVGIAIYNNQHVRVRKDKGKLREVNKKLHFEKMKGNPGVGHTRWATHGAVSKKNAHPHVDCTESFVVVHNGIIKNYTSLRKRLKEHHNFVSETDTEVIPHLIEEHYEDKGNVFEAFKAALHEIEGTYALTMISNHNKDKVYFARNFSPLLIGFDNEALYLASDAPAFLDWTDKAIYLKNGDFGYISSDREIYIENLTEGKVYRPIEKLPWKAQMAKKEGYPHFMLKEIHEQPQAVRRTLNRAEKQISDFVDLLHKKKKIFFTAAGTSYYSCLHGEYSFAKYGLNLEALISSEFIDRKLPSVDSDTAVIAISQSGETADTLEALRMSKEQGAAIASITNTVGSTITRLSDVDIVIGAGPEIGVAATKTFSSQIATICSATLKWAKSQGYEVHQQKQKLHNISKTISNVVDTTRTQMKELATEMAHKESCYYIGKGLGLATALEGALKLKELAYIHAEGYPAGESKHGPISLVEEGFPIVAVSHQGQEEVKGNIIELQSRGGKIITVSDENETIGDEVVKIPSGYSNLLGPLVYVVPLQLLAYYTAVERGHNPDKPRNLAKSVTVK